MKDGGRRERNRLYKKREMIIGPKRKIERRKI
jgi:hypothetical protein